MPLAAEQVDRHPAIRRLSEPARSLARQIARELIARDYPREQIADVAAKQAASYVAERIWDGDRLPREVLDRIEELEARPR